MTVAELIKELGTYPPEAEVIAPYPPRDETRTYDTFSLANAANGKDVVIDFGEEDDDDVPF